MVEFCDKCPLKNNGKLVWGRGNPNADIFFIGEAPGKDESESGLPFTGRSGKLLSKLLKEIEIIENEVYISNIVKHRPPDNRNPFYDEITACQSYIIEEIRTVNPKLIITLGKISGNWFARYKSYEIYKYYAEKRWLPLYHPSYLLRRRSEIVRWKESLKKTIENI